MDMWQWLIDCYQDGSLTLEELEEIMKDDNAARELWDDWADDSTYFITYVREQVMPFICYINRAD